MFTKYLSNYLHDDEYRQLQNFISQNPDIGKLIKGSGGLRKLRWTIRNKGKRGGLRIIYFWNKLENNIYLMTIYAKSEITELSAEQKKY